METTTHDNLEQVLVERLALISRIQQAFEKREPDMPKRFRRGAIQKELCRDVGIHFTGLNKRLVNEAMEGLGFIQIAIDGVRLYRRGERGRQNG